MKQLTIVMFLVIILTTVTFVSVYSLSPSQSSGIPSWIKNTARFWVDDKISDQEFIQALQYLIDKQILVIPSQSKTNVIVETKKIGLLDLIPFSPAIDTHNVEDIYGYSDGLQEAVSAYTTDFLRKTTNVEIGIFDNSDHAKRAVNVLKLSGSDIKIITNEVGADYCLKESLTMELEVGKMLWRNEVVCSYGKVAFGVYSESVGTIYYDKSTYYAKLIVKKLKGD